MSQREEPISKHHLFDVSFSPLIGCLRLCDETCRSVPKFSASNRVSYFAWGGYRALTLVRQTGLWGGQTLVKPWNGTNCLVGGAPLGTNNTVLKWIQKKGGSQNRCDYTFLFPASRRRSDDRCDPTCKELQ